MSIKKVPEFLSKSTRPVMVRLARDVGTDMANNGLHRRAIDE